MKEESKIKSYTSQRADSRSEKNKLRLPVRVNPGLKFVMLSIAVGVIAGAAAAVLKQLVGFFNTLIMNGTHIGTPNYRFLVWPLAGIIVTTIFQHYVVRGNISQGTRLIKQRLSRRGKKLGIFTAFNSVIGCAVTIGFGASGGTEGPTALSGAAFGDVLGRRFGLDSRSQRILIGIGGGAGIAAIFKSPMGGALFALEVLHMEIGTVSMLSLISSCLCASCTAYFLSDFTFDIKFGQYMPMEPRTLGWTALLGVVCGLYSIYYNYTKTHASRLFMSIKNMWVAAAVTGALLSLGAFCFPSLFGEGFTLITKVVNGEEINLIEYGAFAGETGRRWIIIAFVSVLLLKGLLVAASYSGGGIAGDFVPTIFAGCVAGYLFAYGCNQLMGNDLEPWYFALVGMGAVMAGTLHAPLMATFIICETTNTYAYLLPYLIAILISYGTVKILAPGSQYAEMAHDDVKLLLRSQGMERLERMIRFRNGDKKQQDQNER